MISRRSSTRESACFVNRMLGVRFPPSAPRFAAMKTPQANHPIWHTLHVAVVIFSVGGVFLLNASTPDMTEIMGAIQSIVPVGIAQYGFYRHLKKKLKDR